MRAGLVVDFVTEASERGRRAGEALLSHALAFFADEDVDLLATLMLPHTHEYRLLRSARFRPLPKFAAAAALPPRRARRRPRAEREELVLHAWRLRRGVSLLSSRGTVEAQRRSGRAQLHIQHFAHGREAEVAQQPLEAAQRVADVRVQPEALDERQRVRRRAGVRLPRVHVDDERPLSSRRGAAARERRDTGSGGSRRRPPSGRARARSGRRSAGTPGSHRASVRPGSANDAR